MMAECTVATYEYIRIMRLPRASGRKTHVYNIVTNGGIFLGAIKWYAAWRQFCFYPDGGAIWSSGCLKDVQTFLFALKTFRSKYEEEVKTDG